MTTKHKNVQTLILGIGAALFALFLLIKPDYFFKSALNGMSLYVTTVLPALFPFFFCASLLTKIGAAEVCSVVLKKPVKFLFNAPSESAFALVSSLLCGYPVGAATLNSLYIEGYLDTEGVKRAMPVCSTSGPLFILGTVGSALFHDVRTGAIILTSHVIGTFICGLVFRGYNFSNRPKAYKMQKKLKDKVRFAENNHDSKFIYSKERLCYENIKTNKTVCDNSDLSKACINTDTKLNSKLYGKENALSESVAKATLSMLYLGGYIVLANMLADCLLLIPKFSYLPSEIQTVILGVMEMTRGCVVGSQVSYFPFAVALCTFVLTFGGMCVCMQSCSYLVPCGIKTSRYLLCKLCQATAAGISALIIGLITV